MMIDDFSLSMHTRRLTFLYLLNIHAVLLWGSLQDEPTSIRYLVLY